ncbi:MAG: aldo/keto reductase [Dorea sp.]|nr:aldo/keto reductase [Dorea sp.]
MNLTSICDTYTLNNGVKIPCVAFGTYKAALGDNVEILKQAAACGYRYFDTASFYGTETFLGQAIKESKLPREEFFITSKMWKDEMGYDAAKAAFSRSLEKLGTDYLDLYLIHWPLPSPGYKDWKTLDVKTWRALEELYEDGKIRAVGLSNFLPHHIENLLENCRIRPMVNQIEFHPGHTQEAVVNYCKEQDILVQAWSPIGRGRVLEDELIVELAGKYRVSPAQICLRYALQRGVLPLPKSSSPERMRQNQKLFSFEISKEDMYRISTMPPTGWSGEHPERERIRS